MLIGIPRIRDDQALVNTSYTGFDSSNINDTCIAYPSSISGCKRFLKGASTPEKSADVDGTMTRLLHADLLES